MSNRCAVCGSEVQPDAIRCPVDGAAVQYEPPADAEPKLGAFTAEYRRTLPESPPQAVAVDPEWS